MARKARQVVDKKKRAPKKTMAVKNRKPFKFVWVTDLHVNNETVSRVCQVLIEVAKIARKEKAEVVCTGDFWDLRGTLNVRQLDMVQKVLENEFSDLKVHFVPGNHDQVSLDGEIHGLNIFNAFPNIMVTTQTYLDLERGLAFVPWREDPKNQYGMFSNLPMKLDLTIFAHAEVKDAIANSGHRADGKVTLDVIEKRARACYLGHYHKRQQLGDRTWYLGSSFELDIGERDQPHGIAIVSSESIEPRWIDFDMFPKHWRLELGEEWPLAQISEKDIVEVVAHPDDVADFAKVIKDIPAQDVRHVPKEIPGTQMPPVFALTLDAAVEEYTKQEQNPKFTVEELALLGRSILSEVPEAKAIPPLGAVVNIDEVVLDNFCVIPGELIVPLSEMDRALIKAPIRTGKTAIADAVMWCFYGATTPRKAGMVGATLRADDVINDAASFCSVACAVSVEGYEHNPIKIRREKKRGKGSTVSIEGIDLKEGISDQSELIKHVIGYDHALWRACVSLGQGAVANFATDADKRRKDLMAGAFGLESCPAAQKVAKDRLTNVRAGLANEQGRKVVAETQKETLEGQDFQKQSGQWVLQRQGTLDGLTTTGTEAKSKVGECDKLLEGEAAWIKVKGQHETRIANLEKQLAELTPTLKIGELQRQYGAIEAEKLIVDRDATQAQQKLTTLIQQDNAGAPTCVECGQLLPAGTSEQYISAAESLVKSKQSEVSGLLSRMTNVATELDTLNTSGAKERQTVEAALGESREALSKCMEALPQFERIRTNRDEAQRTLTDARAKYTEQANLLNPFEEQARQNKNKIEQLIAELATMETNIGKLLNESELLSFWVQGFGPKGLPVLVLRTALFELETAANKYLSKLLNGTVYSKLLMDGEDLRIQYFERGLDGELRERTYEQLSGGQRRCVELAFAPFALSDLIFNRCGVKVDLLSIDELTTHLGEEEKPRVCEILREIDRKTVLVMDHDPAVQGHFSQIYQLVRTSERAALSLAA